MHEMIQPEGLETGELGYANAILQPSGRTTLHGRADRLDRRSAVRDRRLSRGKSQQALRNIRDDP